MLLPIAFMSFDRPDYLEAVMQSVVRQVDLGAWKPAYFLFQDSVEPRDGEQKLGDPDRVKECVARFREYFPDGEVFEARYNLSVAHNFNRAERFLFRDCGFDCAVFLEDDMLLQPHYLSTLGALLRHALARPEIGMVSAYGWRHDLPLAEQHDRRRQVCLMNEHNWAFGITRDCWERRNHIVERYLEILDDIPYRDRKEKHPEINEFLRSLGRGGKGYLSSQDSIKNMACEVLGIHRISTVTNNARYIGRKGLHMTEQRFFERGYDRTVLYPDAHEDFDLPSPDALRALRLNMPN